MSPSVQAGSKVALTARKGEALEPLARALALEAWPLQGVYGTAIA